MSTLRVLFAPDYSAGNPYQTYLAQALRHFDVEVSFLNEYRRGLPLARGSRSRTPDIVHIHWPEKYFGKFDGGLDRLRMMRYPLDLWLTTAYRPLVWTAHNLIPHNRCHEGGVLRNMRCTGRRAVAVFAHSEAARGELIAQLKIAQECVHVIPFGDHGMKMGPPLPQSEARKTLELPARDKICLVFGTVSPYKGTDELVLFWKRARLSHKLVVVGPVLSQTFANELNRLADGCQTIDLRLASEWLDDQVLHTWLSAADCVLFNYRKIFTSGAAALARSQGVPILIPSRLTTVDLCEPDPHVFRFDTLESEFIEQLEEALATRRDYDHGQKWREATSWKRVAEMTARVYREIAPLEG